MDSVTSGWSSPTYNEAEGVGMKVPEKGRDPICGEEAGGITTAGTETDSCMLSEVIQR